MSDPSSVPRSCRTCPSFLSAEDSVRKFKKSVGAPMCGRFGNVLGKPGLPAPQADKLMQHFAKDCPGYGEPLPPLPVESRMQVVLPDPDARDTSTRPNDNFINCSSCAMCRNFVRDDIVADELGWTAGLCAAKGTLILPNQQRIIGRSCELRNFGPIRLTTAGLPLLPEYEDAFSLNSDPIKAYFKNKKEGRIEPHDYPTDREVTGEDEEAGIRAWRRIVDPAGTGNEIFLPIFRIDFFSEDEQKKIPRSGDKENPELYVDHFAGAYQLAVAWEELDETPIIWGEAGVGKTELARHMAWMMCMPFERISITATSEIDDLAGKMLYDPEKGTYFRYGRIPLAWGKPCIVVIDEPNAGPDEVWQMWRPLFDNSKQMVLDQNEAEEIDRNDFCYITLAANPAWDPKNVGARPIGDADASRLWHIYLDLPPESLEREIIANRVRVDGWEMSPEMLNMVMNIAREVRAACKEDVLPITWGLRPQIKVARALRWFEPITAYRRAIADYLEPEAQDTLLDFVRAHIEAS